MEFNSVTYVVLGMLRRRPRSGYEIKALVDRSTRHFWAASYGQLYPELKRLARAGLIEGQSAPTGGRRRVIYRLTPAGMQTLLDWLREPHFSHELRDEGLLKLFFADALSDEEALELVRAIRRRHERALEQLRAVDEKARLTAPPFSYLTLEYGLAMSAFTIEWFSAVERRLVEQADERRSVA